jgi:hypothetical protein
MKRREFLTAVGAVAVGSVAAARVLPGSKLREAAILVMRQHKYDGGFLVSPELVEDVRAINRCYDLASAEQRRAALDDLGIPV